MMSMDLARVTNADEIQSIVRGLLISGKYLLREVKRTILKKNPLKNFNVILGLNPYAKVECLSRGMSWLRDQYYC